jgi:hypothetical protein
MNKKIIMYLIFCSGSRLLRGTKKLSWAGSLRVLKAYVSGYGCEKKSLRIHNTIKNKEGTHKVGFSTCSATRDLPYSFLTIVHYF